MTTIYFVRHSAPFVEIENYKDYVNVSWDEYNKNMILSVIGEENAKKLSKIEELHNIDEIYASNSFRAIGTAKYVAELNNLKIRLDKRIDERCFGIVKLSELPENFTKHSFDDKAFKVDDGESLNEVDKRLESFINDTLDKNNNKIVVVLHGIILLSYLKRVCDEFSYDGRNFDIKYKNKVILNGTPDNPSIFKIDFDDNKEITNIGVVPIKY